MIKQELASTIEQIAVQGKGILAADESTGTITKRFDTINLESTEENRRAYRELLFTTAGAEKYINGVIMFEETLGQSTKEGQAFADLLKSKGIVPGIKVDKGLVDIPLFNDEKITAGLDGLADRLKGYKDMGAQFAKWRAVLTLDPKKGLPHCNTMFVNAEALARYAATCQALGIVPIVEPEVLMDGENDIDYCEMVTTNMLKIVFEKLHYYRVESENIILKPNMVVSGAACPTQASVEEVAEKTMRALKRAVPAAVPTINFLSGGQTDELSTEHLSAMNAMGPLPWNLSFSYGRALQAPVLKAWQGKSENVEAAQQALLKRSLLNSKACFGEYATEMETA